MIEPMRTSRRSFLTGLAALIACPIKAVIPAVPDTLPGKRRWLWINGSDWVNHHDGFVRSMHICAQRSDGQYFYIYVFQRLEDLRGPREQVRRMMLLDRENAKMTLDSFLNCDCVVGKPCAFHYRPPIELDAEDQAALDAEVVEIVS